jgi:phosphate transport system permease protein
MPDTKQATTQNPVPPIALRRRIVDHLMTGLAVLTVILVLVPLFAIFAYLVYRGVGSINWSFLTQTPKPVGEAGGGMANAIIGSVLILALASILGVPLGVGAGIYLAEYGRNRFGDAVRFTADVLNGVPSIVIGIFAYALVVLPVKHFSTLAGGFALGLMMIPITLRSTEEFLLAVPNAFREAAMALGASKWKTIATVIVPAAYRGILTAVLLAFARVAGETAPLLFTAFGNRFWSSGWGQPTASLPVMIFTYAIAPYEDWHRQAWAAGLVLLGLILVINIVARAILARGIAVPRT